MTRFFCSGSSGRPGRGAGGDPRRGCGADHRTGRPARPRPPRRQPRSPGRPRRRWRSRRSRRSRPDAGGGPPGRAREGRPPRHPPPAPDGSAASHRHRHGDRSRRRRRARRRDFRVCRAHQSRRRPGGARRCRGQASGDRGPSFSPPGQRPGAGQGRRLRPRGGRDGNCMRQWLPPVPERSAATTPALFSAPGEGLFRPLAGARPAVGTPGKLERVPEVRLEMVAGESDLPAVLAAIRRAHPYEEPGDRLLCRCVPRRWAGSAVSAGSVRHALALSSARAARALGAEARVSGARVPRVRTVAVCPGSGGRLVPLAAAAGADVFVTGEVRYHNMREAEHHGIAIVELGHDRTEMPAVDLLARLIRGGWPLPGPPSRSPSTRSRGQHEPRPGGESRNVRATRKSHPASGAGPRGPTPDAAAGGDRSADRGDPPAPRRRRAGARGGEGPRRGRAQGSTRRREGPGDADREAPQIPGAAEQGQDEQGVPGADGRARVAQARGDDGRGPDPRADGAAGRGRKAPPGAHRGGRPREARIPAEGAGAARRGGKAAPGAGRRRGGPGRDRRDPRAGDDPDLSAHPEAAGERRGRGARRVLPGVQHESDGAEFHGGHAQRQDPPLPALPADPLLPQARGAPALPAGPAEPEPAA